MGSSLCYILCLLIHNIFFFQEETSIQDQQEEQDSLQHPQHDEESPVTSQKNINLKNVAADGKETYDHDKKMHEMYKTSNKSKTAQRSQTKESDRLPTRRLKNGIRVCETSECHEAGEYHKIPFP